MLMMTPGPLPRLKVGDSIHGWRLVSRAPSKDNPSMQAFIFEKWFGSAPVSIPSCMDDERAMDTINISLGIADAEQARRGAKR